MKVIFLPPHFSHSNPYLARLGQALDEQGICVVRGTGDRFFPILKNFTATGEPIILHLHWTDPYLVAKNRFYAILLAARFLFEIVTLKVRGGKLVWTIHNLFNHEKRIKGERTINKILIGLCDQVIVHGFFAKKEVMSAYHLSPDIEEKLNVIPHGNFIDSYSNQMSQEQARQELGLKNDIIVYLYFGIIRAYKGIPQLLKAFEAFPSSKVNLIIAGYPQAKDLERDILTYAQKDHRVRSNLYEVPSAKIQVFMNACDVVVLPFQNIFSSGSVLLAMSFGKAIIAPRIQFLEETLAQDGAIFYESNEHNGLQQALPKALHTDLQFMGNQNFKKAKSFDWEEIGARTLNTYQKCLTN